MRLTDPVPETEEGVRQALDQSLLTLEKAAALRGHRVQAGGAGRGAGGR